MSPQPEPVAAINDRLVSLREATVSILDEGIVQGTLVTERIRTFSRLPFKLDEHLQRLRRSLQATGIAPPQTVAKLPRVVDTVLARNAATIPDWQDFAIIIFITPGLNRSLSPVGQKQPQPTVCVHTTPVTQPVWAALAAEGVRLIIPSVRQMPADVLDPHIKHRSRLHWFLADREVQAIDPAAMALLVDQSGNAAETSSGNLLVFDGQHLRTPRPDGVLDGVSQSFVAELATAEGLAMHPGDLSPADILSAEEAFLCSTGYCLLPVTRLNGRSIGSGRPGPWYHRLIDAWSRAVGLDILAQFNQAASAASP